MRPHGAPFLCLKSMRTEVEAMVRRSGGPTHGNRRALARANSSIGLRCLIAAILLVTSTPGETALAAGQGAVESLLEMRHDRVVVQQWDLSCGAAALATILNYQHDDPISERDIAKGLIHRDEYVENPTLVRFRHGFSLLDLKRYVDRRGYEGKGYGQLTLDDLVERAPIMVPVRFNGYNHFVVFRGMRGNRVLLADPAFGNRTMLANSFVAAWLEYADFGRVGFVVARTDGVTGPNKLAPRALDFVSLK